ncbi:MAG: hypothetical protein A2078_03090 [Nitrospirae bacterium GWC2_57_9]|nr:MAG: hypothetical protein A2078_03090 [Nitrospirae bacterium GWC2_57_9]
MNGLLLTVTTWIHLLSAVVWIGGIFFILYVALPVARKTLYQPGKIMGPLSKRFVPPANISIFLIIASGIIMSINSHEDLTSLSGPRAQSLFVKILLVVIMASIHFYRGLILTPGIARLTSKGSNPEQVQKLQTLSLNLVKVNFILGMTVLLLTGVLYVYKA